jgi:hypothetical protein
MKASRGKKAAVVAGALLSTAAVVGATVASSDAASSAADGSTSTHAELTPLNNSGVTGDAHVTVDGHRLEVDLDARHLLKGMPHAEHIHFGAQARQECPTVRDDDNADHRLTTAEGQPAYGPVKVSLTTTGDTSAKSTLAVKRYPLARKGQIHYNRDGIEVSPAVARAIRNGKAVLVVHGIDYNGNGKYDFSAGRSELDPSLPAEATDPVTCGVLEVVEDSSTATPTPTGSPSLPLPLKQ